MALTAKSLFNYGFTVTQFNNSLDFKTVSGGPVNSAKLDFGYYSLSDLLLQIATQLKAADPNFTYTVSADRTINGGLENRITISTNSSYFQLLFSSGPFHASTIAPLIGFNLTDYTGLTSYTSSSSAGQVLVPNYIGYNYISPDQEKKVQGAVSISASGIKESVVYSIMTFVEVEFKHETLIRVNVTWPSLINWMIQQRAFEFTPEITNPNTFYVVTLDKSAGDSKGMGFKWTEMLSEGFPNFYRTGAMTFRQKVVPSTFIV